MKYKDFTSIILPTWFPSKDKEKYVKWALDSLNETTDKMFELIIIDNQSKVASKKFLKKVTEQFKKNKKCKEIKLISAKKNLGWTGAWDLGIKKSEGKYVCVINDDLVFQDKWLSKMIAHIRDDIVAVGPTSNFVSGRQKVRYNTKASYEEKVNYLIGLCLLVKREALDEIKENDYYIDPRFYPGGSEELDLCIRLSRFGYSMVIAQDVFIHHFGSRSLVYLDDFTADGSDFYNKRLQMLQEKYDRETVETLDEFQKCPKIGIGIPSIGYTDASFVAMLPWILQDITLRFGIGNILTIISPRNLTHIGRNEVVKKALQYGVEYLWFLDDDMLVPSDTLLRLYDQKKDFISALAYSRTAPFKPCIYKGKDKDKDWMPDVSLRKGLVEVDATGLSCALIKMSAIKKLIKKNMIEIKERGGLFHFTRYGEDINFTNELKKSGTKIWVDTDLVIKHLGNKIKVDDKTFLRHVQMQQEGGQLK